MSKIRSVSRMEVGARKAAESRAGCRLEHQAKGLEFFGRPDYTNTAKRIMVFVHGCFWHFHFHCRMPKTNRAFWRRKFRRNERRHRLVSGRAKRAGWKVHVLWECQIKKGQRH